MTAAIVTIGDEILIGQITDTNSAWLSKQMTSLGVKIREMVSISDTPEHITSTLDRLIGRVDLILMTGGLGPTKDDLTKATLNEYFGGKMVTDQEVLRKIENFFSLRGRIMIDSNRRQAEVPDNCRPLPNDHGTAPGMWFEKDYTHIISMPGVPYEMKPMVTEQLIPALTEQLAIPSLVHRTIMTQGIPESYLAEMINDWEENLPSSMKLAYLPRPGIVRLRLTVTGKETERAASLIEGQVEKLKKIIEPHIFGYDDELLEQVVGIVLKERGFTVSTAESCTGGNIARLLTSVPGSSGYYKGSVIAYSNEIKTSKLGVPLNSIKQHGAVSREVAVAMASGVRKELATDVSMSVSGIAGPDGGSAEKPVGLVWIAVASEHEVYSKVFRFGGGRELIIEQASIAAIGLLYRFLMQKLLD